jgi:DNA polymerase I-like protein with 3'-5' exonuclease and polymerase domains
MTRWDSKGFAWVEPDREKKKGGGYVGRMPKIPEECDWKTKEFPRLDAAKELTIDIETYDPDLRTKGPGVRRDGYMVGIAVATEDESWYFPMSHEKQYDPSGLNIDRELVLRWARRELIRTGIPKIGTNLMYDLDYLWEEGIRVPGPYYDVQVAEPLIDENAFSYSLDNLANKYLGEGKRSDKLYEWLSLAYGGPATAKGQGGNIYRAPPQLVGEYAIGDVEQPREILRQQRKIMEVKDENGYDLESIFDLETRLIPLLLAMRRRGVRADVSRAEELDNKLMDRAKKHRAILDAAEIDPWSGDTIARWCEMNGVAYRKTAAGNPSFVAKWLEKHSNPMMQSIHQVRRLEKHAGTFISGTVLGNQIKGRIHCQFHQLRGDEYGAVSGRFSSSHPNLQNIPTRDEELGPLIRSLFLPDEGEDWACDDWSQIEFRLLVHYGRGHSAAATREKYNNDSKTDFHVYVADLTEIDRKPAKNINFGLVYGMGEPTMAEELGRPLNEVKPMFNTYHKELPFVRDIFDECDRMARHRGWIRTILGRKRRWPRWGSSDWKIAKKEGSFTKEEAQEKYGNKISRAHTHKALNSLLQGGAADIMKKAMVDIWETGICDILGAPLLTVHDELNWSRPKTKEAVQAHEESKRIMESCVRLKIPLLADSGIGENWGEAK